MKQNMIWPLFKILASNLFSFGTFIEGFKKGVKGIFKNILVIVLVLYFVIVAGGMYIAIMNSVGNGLVNSGDIEKMPVMIVFAAFCLVLFFGFISAATNYYTGCGEEQFLAMPLTPKDIFGAKVGVTAITDAALGAAVMIVGAIIYGIKAKLYTNPLFYLGIIVTTFAIVCLCLFLIYTLLILAMIIFPKLRKRSILTGIATVLVFIFVCGYSLFSSNLAMMFDLSENGAAPALQLIRLSVQKLPFLMIFSDSLSGKPLAMLVMLAVSALFIFAIVPLYSPVYIKTLNGFADVKSKKITKAQAAVVLDKELKSNSVFSTMLTRDFRTVLREPSFFANGPLMIILIPVIFAISFTVSFIMAGNEGILALTNSLKQSMLALAPAGLTRIKHYIVLILAAFEIFMGNCTNIAATSFSREGKALFDLKAMPIETDTIVFVKFWHAFIYCIIAAVFMSLILLGGVLALGLPFTVGELIVMCIKAAVVNLVVSLALIFGEMFIDTVNPKLLWETPTAAFKQNVNAVVSSFISMGVVAIFVVLIFIMPKNTIGMLLIIAIFAVISAPLGYFYFKYAVKKIPKM